MKWMEFRSRKRREYFRQGELNLRDKLIQLDDFGGPFQLEFKDVTVRRNL